MKYHIIILSVLLALVPACSEDEDPPTNNGTGTGTGSVDDDKSPSPPEPIKLAWPLAHNLDDGLFLMNYFDNQSGSGKRDHMCNGHTYDGHTGIDISAYSFQEMDRGYPILSATDGEVAFVDDTNYDRTYQTPYTHDPNMIQVKYADGRSLWYAHLRTNSVSVKVGDQVKKGQILGMIGSSGATPFPHLHFEIREKNNTPRDPFDGNCNSFVGIWEEQTEYKGSDEVKIYDFDITLDNIPNGTYQLESALKIRKEEPARPAIVSYDESNIKVWLFYQGAFGDYNVIINKPDGSEFISKSTTIGLRSFAWDVHEFEFSSVTSDDQGIWELIVEFQGIKKVINFEVGENTDYGPRFYPLRGKTIKLEKTNTSSFSFQNHNADDLTFELLNAPSGTIIEGNSISIGSSQNSRNHFFELVATDAIGRTDTMFFHTIDYSKPPK
ncbi:MAG: M23 family metallopeptidase [Fulvivirga sp.]|uniref:M23 family metallopeptidase n=1 Tax=Fulvivirga sp. TaxID=1931237 RepID=UPI0032F060EF